MVNSVDPDQTASREQSDLGLSPQGLNPSQSMFIRKLSLDHYGMYQCSFFASHITKQHLAH